MSECKRVGWRLFGCKFSGRYDTQEPADSDMHLFHSGQAAIEAIRAGIRKRVYVRDVCERCGRVVERKP